MRAIFAILFFSLGFSLVQADIRPHQSGAWYNKDQSGHGLSIQVLDDERTIAFWFAYTPGGHPMFLLIDGVSDHHTVMGPAYYHEGMIWGQFDPEALHSEVWGEVSIEFLGCDRAVLSWSSVVEGYGDGQVELERLTYVADLECDEVAAELTGEWQVGISDESGGPYTVTVDADGAFEFIDEQACRWEGHIHVVSMEQGDLTAQFGSPTCPSPVPMAFAWGKYYANGATYCSSGGNCISYDQAMGLTRYHEGRTMDLRFLR